jgi:hypothetical protein
MEWKLMKILKTLEQIFIPSKKPKTEHVDLKEIDCLRKDSDFVRQFRTAAVGTAYGNPDGSDRQAALKKLKADEKIRLIWDAGSPSNRQIVYLVCSGRTRKLSMADCFGRLNDKVAADVVQWLNRDNITTSARVVKIVGGTRKRPELGCVLELTTYS